MAVGEGGEVAGSVSGGCVESAVVTAALDLLQVGGRRIDAFGPADADEVFGVGLTCGGNVRVYLEEWHGEVEDATEAALRDGAAFALATVVEGLGVGAKLLVRPGHPVIGTLGQPDLDRVVARDAEGELDAGTTDLRRYGRHGEARQDEVVVFVESFVPAPRLLVFGAVDFTAALVRVAKVLGYHVTVCDARAVFATPRRFPLADEVVVDRPDRLLDGRGDTLTGRDAVCVLTHDHKLDVPAILAALRTDVGYLGAMGSRRTHAERTALLREAGATDADLARVHGPIGLDLGARTPEETAVAICAEIIAARTGRSDVRPLRDTEGPIHARP
jgi:xanthine dehydrogenase accessory factor